jgi:hypothetical protein
MTVKWGPNLAPNPVPTLTPGGGLVLPNIPAWTIGNPRLAPAPDGTVTFTFDGGTLATAAAGNDTISIPLAGAVVPDGSDDALVKIGVHIHVVSRPEGSPNFSMSAPPTPMVRGYVVFDGYSAAAAPPAPWTFVLGYVQRYTYGGPAEGWPESMDLQWLVSRADARAMLAKPNPRIVLLVGTSSGTVHPPFSFVMSDMGVRVQEAAGGGGAATGPVLKYRDPATGDFLPLATLKVAGINTPPPTLDPAHQAIVWATDPRHSQTNLIDVDWAQASIVNGPDAISPSWGTTPPTNPGRKAIPWPAEANLRLTPLADGVKVQWDAFTLSEVTWKVEPAPFGMPGFYTTIDGDQDYPAARVKVPIRLSAHAPTAPDGRLLRMHGGAEFGPGCYPGLSYGTSGGYVVSPGGPFTRQSPIYMTSDVANANGKVAFGQLPEADGPNGTHLPANLWRALQLTGLNVDAPLTTLLARLAEPHAAIQIPLPSVTSLASYGYATMDFTNPHGTLLGAPTAAAGTLPPQPTPGADFPGPTGAVAATKGTPRYPAGEVTYRGVMVIGQEAVAVP